MAEKDDWIRIKVDPQDIEWAKNLRNERDKRYGNIYREKETDLRWVGELGELCFDRWLRDEEIHNYQWIVDSPAGKPDFIINGEPVGVKTVKRKGPMKPHYEAQVTARHVNEPVSYFFFNCFELNSKQLVLLGAITKEEFKAKARYYGPGEQVHADYKVEPGHEIYNIEVKHLLPPGDWLDSFRAA